jgi:hypothetical protein
MAAFLFELEIADLNEDMMAVIPQHREQIGKLFAEGRLLSYSVSIHRNYIWCVVNAEDEHHAMEIVLSFPLFHFFSDISCHPLLFHNTAPAALPVISLN